MNFNININSLDQCIATFQKSDYQMTKPLVLNNAVSQIIAEFKSFIQILADPVTYATTAL